MVLKYIEPGKDIINVSKMIYTKKEYNESCLNDIDWMENQLDIINSININNIDISNNIKKNTQISNCSFENKILFKKALLYTNNNLDQNKNFLNLPFYKRWQNVAKGNKINGQPALKFGIQNSSITNPNQFQNISNIINNRIIVNCSKTISF